MAETVGGLVLPPAVENMHAPGDPPVFILLASPAWGPSSWLPDTALQKVPIGGTGQVLTVQADGSINWQNSPAGFANPMTTGGDLMTMNAIPAPARIALGAQGQVLTVVGGLPTWANPVTGFANPMTGTGDLITSTAGGSPVRLAVGTNGQVLLVSGGTPTWSSSVLVNPMTTLGDIIIAAGGGAAIRLAAGVANQVLTMVAGSPAWANAPSGFANPMTTLGDIITGATGGAAVRLGAGAANQVLTMVSGAPAWANSPAGFANPMTTPQDLIVGGVSGAAGRLGVGINNQVLTVVGGAVAWSNPPGVTGTPVAGPSPSQQTVFQQGDGSMLVIPLSTYGLVGDDGLWINTAYGLLPTYTDPDMGNVNTIGTVRLQAATYRIVTQITVPAQANLFGQGEGTMLQPVGAITCIFQHYGAIGGNNQNFAKAGYIMWLHIDGTNATGAAVAIDIGDTSGQSLEYIWIGNFNTSGAIGLNCVNRRFFTEKMSAKKIYVWNCETAVMFTTLSASNPSFEYCDTEFYLRTFGNGTGPNTLADQRGIVFQGVNYNGSMKVRGNNITPVSSLSPTAPAPIPAQLSFYPVGGTPGTFNGTMDFHMETNGGGLAPYKIFFSDTTGVIGDNGAQGLLRWAGGTDPATPAIGQFAFNGIIDDCNPARRVQAPAVPLTGVGYQNVQCNAFVTITGGTVTQVVVDGVTQLNNVGPFFVAWNRFITVTYTGTLTWSWSNAS